LIRATTRPNSEDVDHLHVGSAIEITNGGESAYQSKSDLEAEDDAGRDSGSQR
jgi:hypothetical protein